MTTPVMTPTYIGVGEGWMHENSAPLNEEVWVTDGEMVARATLCQDAEGLWGWRTEWGFDDFRRREVIAYKLIDKPAPPGLQVIYLSGTNWAGYAERLGKYARAYLEADRPDGKEYELSLHTADPGPDGAHELTLQNYSRRPVAVRSRHIQAHPEPVPGYATIEILQFGPFLETCRVSWVALWCRPYADARWQMLGRTRFNHDLELRAGYVATVEKWCTFADEAEIAAHEERVRRAKEERDAQRAALHAQQEARGRITRGAE